MKKTFVIGISGCSGSGKSTLAHLLSSGRFSQSICVISHDSYYRGTGAVTNWDHPDAIDDEELCGHIDEFVAGRAVYVPIYDFATHSRLDGRVRMEHRPVLIIEGVFVLFIKQILEKLDLRVFIETHSTEYTLRRVLRDVAERGRSLESVVSQMRGAVRDAHEVFVYPSRRNADIVVVNEREAFPSAAVRLLEAQIACFLHSYSAAPG